jgi:hypothetical protein
MIDTKIIGRDPEVTIALIKALAKPKKQTLWQRIWKKLF